MITEQENRTTDNTAPPVLTPLIGGIVNDVQTLIKQQLTLFQTEITNDLRRTRNATIPLIAGGAVAVLAVIVLLLALAHSLVWAFYPNLPLFAGYGIVFLGLGIIAGALIIIGKSKFDAFNPLPDKSVEGLKEIVTWKTKT